MIPNIIHDFIYPIQKKGNYYSGIMATFLDVLGFIIVLLSLCMISLLLWKVIQRFWFDNSNKERKLESKFVKIIPCLCIVSCWISIIFYFIATCNVTFNNYNDNVFVYTRLFAVVFWGLAYFMIYIVFIHRIYSALLDTEYQYSNRIFIILIGLYLGFVIPFILFVIEYTEGEIERDGVLLAIFIAVGFVFNITLSITIMVLYFKRSYQMTCKYEQLLQSNEEMDTNELLLKQEFVKYSVLACFAILSSIIAAIVWGSKFGFGELNAFHDALSWWMFPIDMFITAYSIGFTLNILDDIYNKICKSCNNCCISLCKKLSNMNLKNKTDINIENKNDNDTL